ncbi:YqkE family protein [Paenibacillus arenilitoris]|uniref:YqkE family protein n=1 Tax=Paenibacillus arenilitoris TaxID=2772299 RepID=A0A927CMD4_9BACL|nr:YqkE family protein [Paenibacillus arenilitoris]MBD2869892.1 YqkE family protein [Paenibacillus arenilitoris]
MGKKRKAPPAQPGRSAAQGEKDQAVRLNELLSADVVKKLKAQAEELSKREAERKEAIRKEEEEKKKQERKRLENDFSYLLENSDTNWSKYK